MKGHNRSLALFVLAFLLTISSASADVALSPVIGNNMVLQRDITVPIRGNAALGDFDTTYFNGTQVGATGPEAPSYWAAVRKYVVPGALVKASRNVIAVRIFDHYEGGFKGGNLTLTPVVGGKPLSFAGPCLRAFHVSRSRPQWP